MFLSVEEFATKAREVSHENQQINQRGFFPRPAEDETKTLGDGETDDKKIHCG